MADTGRRTITDRLLDDRVAHTDTLLGNEAIVRGALEAGVAFVSGYPGTPSSEITDSFARLAGRVGIAFEYAVNEKIALDTAFGASLAGARSLCAMKHLGLLYAGDPLSTIPYIGVEAGLVIVSAGDPGCRTSPNEQDQRHLAPMLHVPLFDPPTPQAALELTRLAFEVSEASRLPVILRPTTRVCHTRAAVEYGALAAPRVAGFRRNPRRYNPVPVNARRMRLEIVDRLATAATLIADAGLVRREGEGPLGILAGGVPAATCGDILRRDGLLDEVALITCSAVYPLPERELLRALEGISRLLVLEELSPFLEDALAMLAYREKLEIEILGKRTGHAPVPFEYEPPVIRSALRDALGLGAPVVVAPPPPDVPARPPILCPGCPHRSSFFAARAGLPDEEQLFINDIGCYTLGGAPPLETSDALLCMGAGFTLAAGIARVTGKRTVGFVGDSTFLHSGMPALLDAIKDKVPLIAVVLDNEVTAMTGFQESPTVAIDSGTPVRSTSIEGVARALGATHVERVDPEDLAATIGAFRRAHDHDDGVSVIVCERACPQFLRAATARVGDVAAATYEIDHDLCRVCGREESGARCGQSATTPFSRSMARSRSLEMAETPAPLPAVAPCASRCPLHLCVQGYAAHVAGGHYAEALELIMERLPLPDSVCRVCDRPCEDVCVRADSDGPVAINAVKRFVMDWAATSDVPYDPPREERNGLSVTVVGAGPGGLAAAHDLALRGYDVRLLDAAPQPGGLLRYGIPRYRLPRTALARDIERILRLGVTFVGEQRLGRDVRLAQLLENGADAVFLATGAACAATLPLAGAGAEGRPPVVTALEFLAGTSGSAGTSSGVSAKDARVVVIGGGNAAVDAARTALRRGARSVTIACLESRGEMPAIATEVEHAQREGVALLPRTQITGLTAGVAQGVAVELRGEAFAIDAIEPVADSEREIPADLVVVAVGQTPDATAFGDLAPALVLAPDGSVEVDAETLASAHPRVFAGGDLIAGGRTVTGAIATGQRAAWGIDRALRGAEAADRRRPPPPVTPGAPPTRDDARRAHAEAPHTPPETIVRGGGGELDEVVGVYDEADARDEAARCMICGTCGNCSACIDTFGCPAFVVRDGRPEIDAEICTGCGVCERFCPNGAIRPVARGAAGAAGVAAGAVGAVGPAGAVGA